MTNFKLVCLLNTETYFTKSTGRKRARCATRLIFYRDFYRVVFFTMSLTRKQKKSGKSPGLKHPCRHALLHYMIANARKKSFKEIKKNKK